MFRSRRFVKPVLALIAIGAVAFVAGGCALVKPGSVAVSQPQGIGSVRVHFALCTIGGSFCGPNDENESIQYLAGIAAPPGSVPPASFTAVPIGGGAPIVFTRNEEVAPEIAASSVVLQKTISEATSPEEKEEVEALKPIIGEAWPPAGTQGFGYLSTPVQEVEKRSPRNGRWTPTSASRPRLMVGPSRVPSQPPSPWVSAWSRAPSRRLGQSGASGSKKEPNRRKANPSAAAASSRPSCPV